MHDRLLALGSACKVERDADACGSLCAQLQAGVFVLVGKLTGNPAFGLLAALAAGGFNCVKAILSADKTGFGKAGPLAWIGVQVVLGLLTYMSASA